MTLIGLGGAARAGKDTLARTLRDEYGFVLYGMSDALRDALTLLDPWIVHDSPVALDDGSTISAKTPLRFSTLLRLVGYERAKTVPEVRRLLQQLGTEVGRGIAGEDVWVQAMTRRIVAQYKGDIAAQNDTRIVVTGIRFENELEMIEQLAGRTVYVHRSDALQKALSDMRHASELSLLPKDFDTMIDNNGTLDDLKNAAHELMSEMGVSRMSERSDMLPST